MAGKPALADRTGALFLERDQTLVVSDLHLEKGAAYARRRSFLPPYDTLVTLTKLSEVISWFRPKRVVSLGDSFHDREGAASMPIEFREMLLRMMSGLDWHWITGNHDPEPPKGLPGEISSSVTVSDFTLRHEPSYVRRGEIAGHMHPGARIVMRGQSVRRPCFATDGENLVMPAFGSLTGCLNVRDKAFDPLFSRPAFTAYVTGKDRVFSIRHAALATD